MGSRRLVAAVIALGLTSGCSAAELSCSGEAVITALQSAAGKAVANDDQFAIFDPQASQYEVGGIRTVACSERTCVCKASLQLKLELREGFKHADQVQDGVGILSLTEPYYNNREPSFEIGYTAEMTDDGSQVYVSLRGM